MLRILDRLEAELATETETRQGAFDVGRITHLVGTWYLSAIHSQLVRLDDFGLLSEKDSLQEEFPFVTGDEPEQEILEAMAHRFVVAEVLSGKTDHLRAHSWQIIGNLVSDDLDHEELDRRNGWVPDLHAQLLAGGRHIGFGDYLNRLAELQWGYGEYLRLVRQAFLGWLQALRGASVADLGKSYVWSEPTHSLMTAFRHIG